MTIKLILIPDDVERITEHIGRVLFPDEPPVISSETLYDYLTDHYEELIFNKNDTDPILTSLLYNDIELLRNYNVEFIRTPQKLIYKGETEKDSVYFPIIFLTPLPLYEMINRDLIIKEITDGI